MPLNKKELSKLSPEDRIKRLRLMEEERNKEVSEIGRLIKESMQEIKTGKLADEIAPEQKAVDISRLFETTGEQRLERTARKEAPQAIKGASGYQAITQAYEAYTQLQKLDSAFSIYGSLTQEQKALVGEIGERLNRAEKYMTESDKLASKLTAGRALLYKMAKQTGLG